MSKVDAVLIPRTHAAHRGFLAFRRRPCRAFRARSLRKRLQAHVRCVYAQAARAFHVLAKRRPCASVGRHVTDLRIALRILAQILRLPVRISRKTALGRNRIRIDRVLELHNDRKRIARRQRRLQVFLQFDGMVSGIFLHARLNAAHALARGRIARLRIAVDRNFVACVHVGRIEADSAQRLGFLRGEHVCHPRRSATAFDGTFRLSARSGDGKARRPSQNVELVVSGIVVRRLKLVVRTKDQGLVFVGKPEVAVFAPVDSPAVSAQPCAVRRRLRRVGEVLLCKIVIPPDDKNVMVGDRGRWSIERSVLFAVPSWRGGERSPFVRCEVHGHRALLHDDALDLVHARVVLGPCRLQRSRQVDRFLQMVRRLKTAAFVQILALERRIVQQDRPLPRCKGRDRQLLIAASFVSGRSARVGIGRGLFLLAAGIREPCKMSGREHRVRIVRKNARLCRF